MKTKPRFYSLFQRGFQDQDPKRWHRISLFAYKKPDAVRIYQNALLFGAFTQGVPERSLRVVTLVEVPMNGPVDREIQVRLAETKRRVALETRKFTPGEEICR